MAESKKKKLKLKEKSLSGLRKVAYVTLILMSLSIIGGIGYLVISQKDKRAVSDTITLENIDESISKEIENQIVYTSSEDIQTHYNASGDYTLVFSSEEFTVYNVGSRTQLVVNSRSFSSDSFIVDYRVDKSSANPEEMFELITSSQQRLTEGFVIINEGEESDLYYKTYSYESKDFVTEEDEITNWTIYIYPLEEDGTYGILEIKEENSNEYTNRYLSELLGVLRSLDLYPEEMDGEAVYLQDVASLKISYDRKKWAISPTSGSVSFNYITSGAGESEELDYDLPSLNMYVFTGYSGSNVDDDYLNETLDSSMNSMKTNKESFEEIGRGDASVGSYDMKYVKYKYKYYADEKFSTVQTLYVGYNLQNDTFVRISLYHPDVSHEAVDALYKLFNFIESADNVEVVDKNVLGTSVIEIDKAAIIGKPAVVHIFARACADVKFDTIKGFSTVSGNSYSVCIAGTGSGSFINSDGYVLTNAHVAAMNPIDAYMDWISAATYYVEAGYDISGFDEDGLFEDILTDVVYQVMTEYPGTDFTDEYVLQYVYEYTVSLLQAVPFLEGSDSVATITRGDYKNYIQKDSPFDVNGMTYDLFDTSKVYSTELVDYNEINSQAELIYKLQNNDELDDSVPDLALLKIVNSSEDFYSIGIEDPDLISSGQSILVMGFPAIVERTGGLFSEESSTIPTITRGAISAIKSSYDNNFDLIQIDASVSGGNSGGPIFNSNGKQVGVVTYGVNVEDEGGDYNAGISVEEVNKFLLSAGVENIISDKVSYIEGGLDDLDRGFYKRAIEKFTLAMDGNKGVEELLSPLLKIAKLKIEAGEDKTPMLTIAGLEIGKGELTIAIIVTAIVLVGVVVLVILIVLRARRDSKKDDFQVPSVPEVSPSETVEGPVTFQPVVAQQPAIMEPENEEVTQPSVPEQVLVESQTKNIVPATAVPDVAAFEEFVQTQQVVEPIVSETVVPSFDQSVSGKTTTPVNAVESAPVISDEHSFAPVEKSLPVADHVARQAAIDRELEKDLALYGEEDQYDDTIPPELM